MAKEKTDATSLFSAMNKNRAKITKTVKKANTPADNDSNAQNVKSSENAEDLNKMTKQENKKEKKTTHMVNELFDSNSNITDDIKKDHVGAVEGDEEKSIQEVLITEGNDTSTEEYTDADDNAASKGIKGGKQDKDLQHIHIALPRDVFEKLEIAKKAYYNNKTTYIRNLILNDYEKNKEYYDKLPNIR